LKLLLRYDAQQCGWLPQDWPEVSSRCVACKRNLRTNLAGHNRHGLECKGSSAWSRDI